MYGPDRVLIDSSFLFALFNERDQNHAAALKMAEWRDIAQPILAWPVLYETINTRLIRRPTELAQFQAIARAPATILLDDTPYRTGLPAQVLAQRGATGSRSLVDTVLCKIIEDVNVQVSAMLTFDTRDFWEICQLKGVELLTVD